MPNILTTIASACHTLSLDALLQIADPALVARVAAGTSPSVAFRFGPPVAAVFVGSGDETFKIGDVGADRWPDGLDRALSDFLTQTLDGLPDDDQRLTAAHLRAGTGKLAVVARSFPVSFELILFRGPDDPLTLARVPAPEPTTH